MQIRGQLLYTPARLCLSTHMQGFHVYVLKGQQGISRDQEGTSRYEEGQALWLPVFSEPTLLLSPE